MQPKNVNLGMSRVNPEDPKTPEQQTTQQPEAQAPEAQAPEAQTPTEPLTVDEVEEVKKRVVDTLCTCFDPEIPVNIYELGLIYDVTIHPHRKVDIRMTLTSPACPVAGSLPGDVQRKIEAMPEVQSSQVDLVWDPPWDPSRMSEAAKLQLGFD